MCALSSANISIGATKVQIFIETAKFLYIFGKKMVGLRLAVSD
jgi:hypothetical protein